MRNNRPVLGVMHQPYTGEMFIGDGGSARINGPRGLCELRVCDCEAPADATLMTTELRRFKVTERTASAAIESAGRLNP